LGDAHADCNSPADIGVMCPKIFICTYVYASAGDHEETIMIDKGKECDPANIRTLCRKCLSDYESTNEFDIKRVSPRQQAKEACTYCDRWGFDYFVTPKKKPDRQRKEV
jgi:hypothetical protein